LQLLRSAAPLKHRARVHFHANTSETIAEVHLYNARELKPGESALAHLRLADEILLLPGDRFIIRQFSPVTTIGGGAILDAQSRRPSAKDAGRTTFLETLERGDHT